MIAKKPVFFCKGFSRVRKLYCEKCGDITKHNLQVMRDGPNDGVMECLITCLDCYVAFKKLEALDLDCKDPTKYQRFFTAPWVFLIIHKGYLD